MAAPAGTSFLAFVRRVLAQKQPLSESWLCVGATLNLPADVPQLLGDEWDGQETMLDAEDTQGKLRCGR